MSSGMNNPLCRKSLNFQNSWTVPVSLPEWNKRYNLPKKTLWEAAHGFATMHVNRALAGATIVCPVPALRCRVSLVAQPGQPTQHGLQPAHQPQPLSWGCQLPAYLLGDLLSRTLSKPFWASSSACLPKFLSPPKHRISSLTSSKPTSCSFHEVSLASLLSGLVNNCSTSNLHRAFMILQISITIPLQPWPFFVV